MSEHYTDEDVRAGYDAWYASGAMSITEAIQAVLDAVAPVIAARALRDAADADWPWPVFSKASPHVMHSWLCARADEIEGKP